MAYNVIDSFTLGGYTYSLKSVSCGKDNCAKCPHGPYWYLSFKTRHGKTVTKYVGKELPEGVSKP